jgi:hypothetical protein
MAAQPWWKDPDAQEWLARAHRELLPKIKDSSVVMSLYNGKADAKMAIETGFAVLLDKPMIGAVTPGCKAPRKLIAVCDELIEVDMTDAAGSAAAMEAAMRRLGLG